VVGVVPVAVNLAGEVVELAQHVAAHPVLGRLEQHLQVLGGRNGLSKLVDFV
jgi:hypothetical protein